MTDIKMQIQMGKPPLVFNSHLPLDTEELENMTMDDIDTAILTRYNAWLAAINTPHEEVIE